MKVGSSPTQPPKPVAAAEPKALTAARSKLTALATTAAAKTIVAQSQSAQPQAPVTVQHPLLKQFGDALGMGLGVIVTEALALVPSWNTPVLGADGKPVNDVPGATRIGNHDILKRHEEVVGPQVAALVQKMPPGAVHDLLAGFAEGATAAPGTSYRLESKIEDSFEK
ncbi:MAG: hypothetical protein JST54_11285 [Deltaproteobacteria bacterium]|nr:hypothetical protein [Deltaproteobacteria bacterium]